MSTSWTPTSTWMRLFALVSASALLVVLLAACGGSDAPTTAATTNSSTASTASTADTAKTTCDKLLTVTFTEKKPDGQADQYFFNPAVASIKAGEYIAFTNQTDERHTLIATPDADLTNSVIDENETQPVQFNQAGNFTVESKDAAHRGSMKVTVSSDKGQTCDMKAAIGTLTFAEKKAAGQADQYSFTPNTETLKVGDSITLANNSDEIHTFVCTPDAGLEGGNIQLDQNERQPIKFAQAGKYQCGSKEHPDAKVTITVQ